MIKSLIQHGYISSGGFILLQHGVLIIGLDLVDSNTMALSLHHTQRIMLEHIGGFADGVVVKVVGEETFKLCRDLLDRIALVSHDAICASIKDMFEEKRSILEPARALTLVGENSYCKYYGLKDETIIAITSETNMNFECLRLVTQIADVGAKMGVVLATFGRDEHGSFKKFCDLVGKMNITKFKYRYAEKDKALVLYSVGVHKAEALLELEKHMESSRLIKLYLIENDLAKDHL